MGLFLFFLFVFGVNPIEREPFFFFFFFFFLSFYSIYIRSLMFPHSLHQLCTPALLYFLISMMALLIVGMQNLVHNDRYHIGSQIVFRVPHTLLLMFTKFVYILFWTYVINLICHDGHPMLSWALVFLPWIVLFIFLGLLMINGFHWKQKNTKKKWI